MKVTGNREKHKRSDEFDLGPEQTAHFGFICP